MKTKLLITLLTACIIFAASCSKEAGSVSSANNNGSGQNGSLTRFIVVNNHLYTISNDALNVYNITNAATPVFKNTQRVGFAIQTIFPYKDKLFIGSNNAMYIYSIANPEAPARLSEAPYFVRGKDPIVAIDSVAYSTVRNDLGSGGVLNCFDIKNINRPITVNSLAMVNPYGLGIKDSALYVCEAESGIKVFSVAQAYDPVLKKEIKFNETAYDVIVKGNVLICYVKGGMVLFDISNAFTPVVIATVKN
jgi:hypothetical protein